jgi:hypothetical protein
MPVPGVLPPLLNYGNCPRIRLEFGQHLLKS